MRLGSFMYITFYFINIVDFLYIWVALEIEIRSAASSFLKIKSSVAGSL